MHSTDESNEYRLLLKVFYYIFPRYLYSSRPSLTKIIVAEYSVLLLGCHQIDFAGNFVHAKENEGKPNTRIPSHRVPNESLEELARSK